MPNIFLSYSQSNSPSAQRLKHALNADGHSVWRDRENLHGGQPWPEAIGDAIAACDFFLLLWSQNAAKSRGVNHEWNVAVAHDKIIIPCKLDNTPLPPMLFARQYIDFGNFDSGLMELRGELGYVSYTGKRVSRPWRLILALISVIMLSIYLLFPSAKCQFAGMVVDEKGRPVVGADVIILDDKGRGKTNREGEFSFEVNEREGKDVQVKIITQNGLVGFEGLIRLPGPVTIKFE